MNTVLASSVFGPWILLPMLLYFGKLSMLDLVVRMPYAFGVFCVFFLWWHRLFLSWLLFFWLGPGTREQLSCEVLLWQAELLHQV